MGFFYVQDVGGSGTISTFVSHLSYNTRRCGSGDLINKLFRMVVIHQEDEVTVGPDAPSGKLSRMVRNNCSQRDRDDEVVIHAKLFVSRDGSE